APDLDHLLVALAHRGEFVCGRHDDGLGVLISPDHHHEPHRRPTPLPWSDQLLANRTTEIGGSRASGALQLSPQSSDIHSPPLVDPNASRSPLASIASACRHTRS